jgi:hypothetical protein
MTDARQEPDRHNQLAADECRRLITKAGVDFDLSPDQLFDALYALGEEVLRLEWDSDGPYAGAGSEVVLRVGGEYVRVSEDVDGWTGPFQTIEEALATRIYITSAVTEIHCSELNAEELVERMELNDPPPVLAINGEEWSEDRLRQQLDRSVSQRLRAAQGQFNTHPYIQPTQPSPGRTGPAPRPPYKPMEQQPQEPYTQRPQTSPPAPASPLDDDDSNVPG